ncbi:phenylalanyl-tRNA synthetase, alpha subunit [Candidatus Nitrososphaera evergladensis SR1]|uniref:phenylalanine--tRNA ligase n=1 Tax=Candidatus Nitrososphaera evergladensis SR1 TaxID=1459636 RepID=A0A075MQI6_9ARCH|nr:phenylalanine--tRNA ligase subunit alpha [Candidatus Nitrososphaera evergladensis]AIF83483.1 phenylalanyl-tRNA synthetase, alpha subunit [Candidatus Nitrososphaera evergladensis SR1]
MSSDAAALHPIERAILKALSGKEELSIEKLAEAASLSIDQARRGVEWLKFKNLASVNELSTFTVALDAAGTAAAQSGLPERRLVRAVKEGKTTMADVLTSGALKGDEVNAAVSGARRNQWIQFAEGNRMSATETAETQSAEEVLLARLQSSPDSIDSSALSEQEKKGLDLLKKRPKYVTIKEQKESRVSITETGRALLPAIESEKAQERRLTSELITSGKWKEVEFSALDVEAPAPAVYPGRSHPLVDIIEEVKEIFVGLGFSEIDGPMVQSGFWNFDALFTPQDHPAREMQDTFYISGERQEIPASKEQIAKVSGVHKQGWSGWNPEEAKRMVLRTHTTPVTLQHLAETKPEVARFFSVGRVFRNEKVSYKHLVEFHQVEGVATAPKASLRDLMGLQKEFYARMGIKKVKFWPTFFPYTEPSLQSMVYNDRLEKWVELFGMGIFRPEVTRPLGIKNPVLAWGGGLERIAMLRFGLDDVRDLYINRVSWLRSVPRCQL